MATKIVKIPKKGSVDKIINEAAKLIRSGKLVAFPTETVYGLGADATSPKAVLKIFDAKNRPADNPLIVHISDVKQLEGVVKSIPKSAQKLIDKFWPGPLSLVLPRHPDLPPITTAGLDTVVVRYPSHPIAQKLITASKTPIAAPSANLSGKVSPTRAEHVVADLDGRVSMIIDAGSIEYGLESTVVDCTSRTPEILRPGSITYEMLIEVVPTIKQYKTGKKIKSPGMKYRHYATDIPIILFTGNSKSTARTIKNYLKENDDSVVLLWHDGGFGDLSLNHQLPSNSYEAGPLIFDALRTVDGSAGKILIQGYDKEGIGAAIMNRLEKAATEIIET
jgi:L-threonylcarbamoyladenylate synthase